MSKDAFSEFTSVPRSVGQLQVVRAGTPIRGRLILDIKKLRYACFGETADTEYAHLRLDCQPSLRLGHKGRIVTFADQRRPQTGAGRPKRPLQAKSLPHAWYPCCHYNLQVLVECAQVPSVILR